MKKLWLLTLIILTVVDHYCNYDWQNSSHFLSSRRARLSESAAPGLWLMLEIIILV